MDQIKSISKIQHFYDGQNVFITGGTGFMGKVLIEKLLRSCPGLNKIYMLVRPKRNVDVNERLDQFFSSSIFNLLNEQNSTFREKVIGIKGDVSQPGLGISLEDRAFLVKQITIVFHMAATVRFDEKLPDAIDINIRSVKDIIDLSKECKSFKAGVYISTAYSNCIYNKILEVIYEPPLSYEESIALAAIIRKQKWTDEELTEVTKKIIGKWPNTYTFTKAIAENVVAAYAKDIPFSIIRPSIVIPTLKEPEVGWTDSLLGPSGVMVGVGLGVIRIALAKPTMKCNIVPCDMACMAIIASAWETGVKYQRNNEHVPVYNYVSQDPITWNEFKDKALESIYNDPSVYIIYYPCLKITSSVTVYKIYSFFLQMIPTLIFDAIARYKGRKPVMYDMYKKGMNLLTVLQFFSLQQWDFDDHNVKYIWNNMTAKDKELFPFLTEKFDWDELFKGYVVGLKKFFISKLVQYKTVKPKLDTPELARRHYQKLYLIHKTIVYSIFIFVIWIIWKVVFNHAFSTSRQLTSIG